MSKNKKSEPVVEVENQPIAEEATTTLVEATAEAKETAKANQTDKNAKVKDNKKSNKKPAKEKGKFKRKAKETMSELKKVTWPTFGEVCKRTGVVLVVVLVFAVVIFGIDYCLGLLTGLLKK